MCLGIQANKVKIGVLLAYLCSKIENINLRKLMKLVFLIDEAYVKENGYPLTWMDYYVWEKGPVAPKIYNIKNNGGIFSNYVKTVKKTTDGKHYVYPATGFDIEGGLAEFGEYHLEVINSIIQKYGHLSADELSDVTHTEDSIWSIAVKGNRLDFKNAGKTDIKLDLITLIKGDSDKYNAYVDALENMQFTAALNP
ncbi:hypothetical protein SAMD00024442_4_36 [Candidatus Symbiothrix dinenymphae]|nr:hypothetical protein SAMD00024442_4_36 [Candidatus Symbiothrix dinenymphae]